MLKDTLVGTAAQDVRKARMIAAHSLRSRAECYRSIGEECFNQKLATEVETLVRELNAAASSLDSMN
jgi:hypothetical protein